MLSTRTNLLWNPTTTRRRRRRAAWIIPTNIVFAADASTAIPSRSRSRIRLTYYNTGIRQYAVVWAGGILFDTVCDWAELASHAVCALWDDFDPSCGGDNRTGSFLDEIAARCVWTASCWRIAIDKEMRCVQAGTGCLKVWRVCTVFDCISVVQNGGNGITSWSARTLYIICKNTIMDYCSSQVSSFHVKV